MKEKKHRTDKYGLSVSIMRGFFEENKLPKHIDCEGSALASHAPYQ